MQLLLEEGADVDQRNVVSRKEARGRATRKRHPFFFPLTHPLFPIQMGETPLIRAAHNGHPAALACLLGAGAAVGAVDAGDNTPLHWAAMRGHVECVTALLKAGADPHARNKQVENGFFFWGGRGFWLCEKIDRSAHTSPLQDKTPADLCQPCWSPAYRYTREALAAGGA